MLRGGFEFFFFFHSFLSLSFLFSSLKPIKERSISVDKLGSLVVEPPVLRAYINFSPLAPPNRSKESPINLAKSQIMKIKRRAK